MLLLPALLGAPVAHAIAPAEVPNPRPRGAWVVDLAEALDAGELQALEQLAEGLHRDLSVEAPIVIVRDTDQVPKTFTTALFNAWGVGDDRANNGLLTVMVMDQRRLEMETGYGLEPLLTDGWLGTMQGLEMVPHFKRGDYGAGLVAGMTAIDRELRAHPLEARLGTAAHDVQVAPWPERPEPVAGASVDPAAALFVSGGLGLGAAAFGVFVVFRRRQRTCPDCAVYMPQLDEATEDAHLDAGQQKEEEVGSVEWDVFACPTCAEVRTFGRERWFSGFDACPRCRHKTARSSRTVVQSPTTTSTGHAVVTVRCEQCSYHDKKTVILARVPPPSSSSSSGGGSSSSYSGGSSSSYSGGGSSFGGGSSGGGGAGSSW